MIIHNFSEQKSVIPTYVSELRDVNRQKDRLRFRFNLERIGQLLGYELSKTFDYVYKEIKTPLGQKKCLLPNQEVVICSILRAGIPLHNGLLNCFDEAGNTFISAYRKHDKNDHKNFEIIVEYCATPSIDNKVLIIADPMLATGSSIKSVYEALKPYGKPQKVHIVSVIGAQEGVNSLDEFFKDENVDLWIAAIDSSLDENKYIVPGLGDAGDLAFGEKI